MKNKSVQVIRGFRIPMLPNEIPAAYRAFCDYYKLGTMRSHTELWRIYKKQDRAIPPTDEQDSDLRLDRSPTTNLRTIRKWSIMYRWDQRVRDTEAKYYEYENQVWAAKKADSRIKDYDSGEKLRDLAKQILDEAPKFLKTRWIKAPDGTRTQIVALDAELAVKALKAASLLQERATGGREEIVNVNVRYYTVEANPDQWPPASSIIEGEIIKEESKKDYLEIEGPKKEE